MRKLIAATLLSIVAFSSVAHADGYYYRHYHGGGGGGGNWVAPLVGGMIIGGLLAAPRYEERHYYDESYDDDYGRSCRRYYRGHDVYGRRVYETVCE